MQRIALGATVALAVLTGASLAAGGEITGTPGDDVLTGTPGRNTIRGLAGNDTITPGRGDDRAFGGEGYDFFFWRNGDGHDRIDGGTEGNDLTIDPAGEPLRLHFDTPAAGAGAADGVQVIGVVRIGFVRVNGGDGPDRLALSSDAVFPPPEDGRGLDISTGLGRDRIDLRRQRAEGIWLDSGPGDDVIRLGLGPTEMDYRLEDGPASLGHDTIYGFSDDDHRIVLAGDWWPCSRPQDLDTNDDGRLSARDRSVRVSDGSMTIDLLAGVPGAPRGGSKVTLVGRTSIPVGRLSVLDEGCS